LLLILILDTVECEGTYDIVIRKFREFVRDACKIVCDKSLANLCDPQLIVATISVATITKLREKCCVIFTQTKPLEPCISGIHPLFSQVVLILVQNADS